MRAADVMTPDPVCISPDASITDAIRLMLERKFSGLPVGGCTRRSGWDRNRGGSRPANGNGDTAEALGLDRISDGSRTPGRRVSASSRPPSKFILSGSIRLPGIAIQAFEEAERELPAA